MISRHYLTDIHFEKVSDFCIKTINRLRLVNRNRAGLYDKMNAICTLSYVG